MKKLGMSPFFVFCGAVVVLFALVKVSDTDTWWHLAGGRLIAEGSLPRTNTFSHTYPDYPWHYTQWLFGLVLYLVHRAFGIGGVEFLQIAMVAAAFLLALDTARLKVGRLPWLAAPPILALALGISRLRFVPRPHLATFVGLALLLNLRQRDVPRRPLWFALIGLVWGNMHAGTGFGLAAALAMAAASGMARDWPAARRDLLAAAAFLLGTLANPNGLYPYLYSFGHLSVNRIVPLYEFRHASWPNEAGFFVFAALALAAVPFRLARRDFLYPLLTLVFLPLAVDAVRVIPKFALVVLPGMVTAASDAGDRLGKRRWAAIALWAAAAALAVFVSVRTFRAAPFFSPFGWGLNARLVPEGAAAFVERTGLAGRMFNDFDQGGYLAWRLFPARRIFLDGRVQTYPPSFFAEILSHSRSVWPGLMDKYGVDYAVVERRPFGADIDVGILFEAMGWPLVYLDGRDLVYVKPGTPNDGRTAGLKFFLVGSRTSPEELYERARSRPADMLRELARIPPGSLLRESDFHRFGAAAFAAGGAGLGESFFRQGLEMYPGAPQLALNLGWLYLRTGRREEARRLFRETADRWRGRPAAADAARGLKAADAPDRPR